MAKLLKLRRGTTSQHSSFTGAEGECTVDTTKDTLVVHDGTVAGGRPLLRQDLDNIGTGVITESMLGNVAVVASKIAPDAVTDAKLSDHASDDSVRAVSANHIKSGAITDAKVNASAAIALSKLASTGAIGSAVTATTQSASDNSTKIATTAYVDTAVSNLVDSAPGALNTLNELAAAVNDDANFSTTITNSIAAKLPLAGGTMSGDIAFGDSNTIKMGASHDLNIYHNGTDSIIDNNTNNLEIVTQNSMLFKIADAENTITCNKHGSVDLFHDNSKKFETTSSGVLATGAVYSSTGVVGENSSNNIDFTTDNRMAIHINGSEEFRFESDGDFHADGDVIAFSTTIASDENLKDNIEEVTDALSKCQAIRGVTFDWKKTGEKSAGVIAQDVQNILPEAVKEVKSLKDDSTHLTVNYHALMSVLIEAIKELKAKVDILESK
tara:strand:+ start:873 stop:2192 length:1320 start_codon:yes stop_codon:yes gene_type:complete